MYSHVGTISTRVVFFYIDGPPRLILYSSQEYSSWGILKFNWDVWMVWRSFHIHLCLTFHSIHPVIIISNVNDTKTEAQTFRNILMCSKKGSRTFLFSPKTLNRNHNVFMCSRTFKIEVGTFLCSLEHLNQNQNILMCSRIF